MDDWLGEGIVLRVTPFRDYEKILTVFSKDHGIISLILKKEHLFSLSPLTRVELVYKPLAYKEIWKCQEYNLLNSYLELREKLSYLEPACELLQCILSSQLPGKPAPLLYRLILSYLEVLPLSSFPEVFVDSLRIKILKHDGFLGINSFCSQCKQPLDVHFIVKGENFCHEHAPPFAIPFTSHEVSLTKNLADCRKLQSLMSLPPSELSFQKKIKTLFTCCRD